MERLGERATFTRLGAVLFATGVVLLFVALYTDPSRTAWSRLPLFALCVLAATAVCWIAAARYEGAPHTAARPVMTVRFEPRKTHHPARHEVQAPVVRPHAIAKETSKPANSDRPLAYPLTLPNGIKITTLRQAAVLIIWLQKYQRTHRVWQHAAVLLMQAHKSDSAADVRAATDQLRRALQMEGWM